MCIHMYMKLYVQGTDMKLECFMYNIYKSIISILLPKDNIYYLQIQIEIEIENLVNMFWYGVNGN